MMDGYVTIADFGEWSIVEEYGSERTIQESERILRYCNERERRNRKIEYHRCTSWSNFCRSSRNYVYFVASGNYMIQGGAWTMNKEYRKRLFALMDEIDDLAKMGIHLEKEEVTGEVEMLQEPEKAQPKIEVKKSKIEEIPEEPTGPNHDTTRRYSANFRKFIVNMHKIQGIQIIKNDHFGGYL